MSFHSFVPTEPAGSFVPAEPAGYVPEPVKVSIASVKPLGLTTGAAKSNGQPQSRDGVRRAPQEEEEEEGACCGILFCLALQCGGLALIIVGLVQENELWMPGLAMSLFLPCVVIYDRCMQNLEKNCPCIHGCVKICCEDFRSNPA